MPLSKKDPEGHKAKISARLKGRTFSAEHRKRISDSQTGEKNHMFGKTGHLNHFFGRKHTQVTKDAISIANKGRLVGEKNPSKRFEVRKRIGEANAGAKSGLWKGGISKLNNLLRRRIEYKEWRKSVYKRDNYTCVICGTSGMRNIEADHIRPLALVLRENSINDINAALACADIWEISNGRTLCNACHKKTDTYQHGTKRMMKEIYG